jgi:signal transduction histidine kinase
MMQAVVRLQIDAVAPATVGDEAVFSAVSGVRRLRGVFAVQVYNASGALARALPLTPEREMKRDWPAALSAPVARFNAQGLLEAAYGLALEPGVEPTQAPLLEVLVPLRPGSPGGSELGTARYWLDGRPLAEEFARLDQRLAWQAGLAFAGGAAVVAAVLAWAFGRLGQAQRRLERQGYDLARANEELAFSARTEAIGAITAHLIHGLKNPLSGLEGYVADRGGNERGREGDEAWRAAVETTRRLRALVNEVTEVLREESGMAGDYLVPVADLLAGVEHRLNSAAKAKGTRLVIQLVGGAPRQVTARVSNLASLVLVNVGSNAIEAAVPGGQVTLREVESNGSLLIEVADDGPGLPEALRAQIFRPVQSTKPGGGGIGLAISHELARHAGGALELVSTGKGGTVFRLRVPTADPVVPKA